MLEVSIEGRGAISNHKRKRELLNVNLSASLCKPVKSNGWPASYRPRVNWFLCVSILF